MLTWAPARALGNISYSYYLIHGLTLKAAFMIVGAVYPPHVATPLFWVLLLPMFAATIVPAFCLFTLVERPFSIERENAPRPAAAQADRAPRPSASQVGGFLTDPAA
jgi:peptidoglycan/LPS O-acetylase OafA/YrhL